MPNHQRGFSQILILLILMAGLVATVISVKQPKIFFSRAQSNQCKGAPTQQIAEDLGPSGKPGYAQNYNIYPDGCREKAGEEYLIGSPMANIAVDLGLQGKPGYAQNYNIFPDGKWEKDGEPYKIEGSSNEEKITASTAISDLTFGRPEKRSVPFGSVDSKMSEVWDAKPLSLIPSSCESLGKSLYTVLYKRMPNTSGLPDIKTSISHGWISWREPIARAGLYVSNSGLVYLWDDAGTIPLSQGGEDPRYVMRVVRVSASLGDPNFKRYWFGRKNGGLDLKDGCESIQRLKEEWKQKGQPLPSDDDLERQAYLYIG